MTDQQWLAEQFEQQRPRLRAVAYRMLGSLSEADDAVQDAWLRASSAATDEVENLDGWLTTIVARVALNVLRRRNAHPERSLEEYLPDPIIESADGTDPEHETLLADSVGLALLVVLEALTPGERLAFVLHDMFAMPFEEIAPIVERSPEATRQLASRARRRVRGDVRVPDAPLAEQWKVVDAFLAAARDGDFDALVAVLDPDVVLRADGGVSGLSHHARGAKTVARQATMWSRQAALTVRRALVNGAAGLVSERDGTLVSVGAFTVRHGRIVELSFLVDPERLAKLDLRILSA
jgi:RNA polymerase sigma factor (sigma-70 family)